MDERNSLNYRISNDKVNTIVRNDTIIRGANFRLDRISESPNDYYFDYATRVSKSR